MGDIHPRTFHLGTSVVGEGTSWGRRSWTQALEADQTQLHIAIFKKRVFKQKFRPKYAKNHYI